jgi:hypothetical protein
LAADSFANSSVPGPQLAVYAISYPTSAPLRDRSTANIKIRRRNVSGLTSSQPKCVPEYLPIRLEHISLPMSPLLKYSWIVRQL